MLLILKSCCKELFRDLCDFAKERPFLTITALGSGAALALLYQHLRAPPRSCLPPGPRVWPLLGGLVPSPDAFHLDCMTLTDTYGDVFSLQIGGRLVVILNSYEAIVEVFLKRESTANDQHTANPLTTHLADEIVFAPYGDQWEEDRTFAVQAFNTSRVESAILTSVDDLVAELAGCGSRPLDVAPLITAASANVAFDLLFSQRYDHRDPNLQRLVDVITSWYSQVDLLATSWSHLYLPTWLSHLLARDTLASIEESLDKLEDFITGQMERPPRRRRSGDAGADLTLHGDLVDEFLAVTCDDHDDPAAAPSILLRGRRRRFVDRLVSLLPGAVTAPAVLLRRLLLYVAAFPDLQRDLHDELDSAVPPDAAQVSLCDLSALPLLEATLLETLRHGGTLHFSVSPRGTCDTQYRDRTIPRSAEVIANFYAVHMDGTLHPDPHEFWPERFLDEETGGVMPTAGRVISVGVGPRAAPWQQHVQRQVLLFAANLLLAFSFRLPRGESHLDLHPSPPAGRPQQGPEPLRLLVRLR